MQSKELLEFNPLIKSSAQEGVQMSTNLEINESIENLRQVLREQRIKSPELNEQGVQISAAIDKFLLTSQAFLREKNSDQALQKFVNHAIALGEKIKSDTQFHKLKYGGISEGNKLISRVLDSLKSLVNQIFTSTDTRTVLRNVAKVQDKFYEAFKKLRDENKKLTDLPQGTREELVREFLCLYSKAGNVPAQVQLRTDALNLFDYWRGSKEHINAEIQKEFVELFNEALVILDRFTEKDLTLLKKKFVSTYNSLETDKEAVGYFTEMRKWTDELISNPALAESEGSIKRGNELITRALQTYERHYDDLKDIGQDVREVIHSFQSERYLTKLKENVVTIGQSLQSSSYLGTLVQLRTILAPIISEGLKKAPLPTINQSDDTSSWTLYNIHIDGNETFLDDIRVDIKVGIKDIIKVSLAIKHIDVLFKNVDFKYARTSLPTWSDEGKLDIKVHSPGWKLKWVVNQKLSEPYFELQEVDGRIKNIDISVVAANHTWIDALLLQMWAPSIRRNAQESLERVLRERAAPLTDRLNKYFAQSIEESTGTQIPAPKHVQKELVGESFQAAAKDIV